MTAQMPGASEYYKVLGELDLPTTLSGRRTTELEMALSGKFAPHDNTAERSGDLHRSWN